jgi:hypothetical protein
LANEDRDYTEWLRSLPCTLAGHGVCNGALHVHHSQGRKGLGTRNHDHSGKPLCAGHHTQRHSLSGFFKGFTKPDIREWEEAQAQRLRGEYLGLGRTDTLEF